MTTDLSKSLLITFFWEDIFKLLLNQEQFFQQLAANKISFVTY